MDAQEVIPPTYRTGHITQAQWLAILAGLDETGRAGLSAALAAAGVYANGIRTATITLDATDLATFNADGGFDFIAAPGDGLVVMPMQLIVAFKNSVEGGCSFRFAWGEAIDDAVVITSDLVFAEAIGPFLKVFPQEGAGKGMASGWSKALINNQKLRLQGAAYTPPTSLAVGDSQITVASAGLAYAVADHVSVDTGGESPVLVVDTIGLGGAVLTYHWLSRGLSDISVQDGWTTTAVTGIGTGLEIDVLSVDDPTELEATAIYTIRNSP